MHKNVRNTLLDLYNFPMLSLESLISVKRLTRLQKEMIAILTLNVRDSLASSLVSDLQTLASFP